MRSPCCATAAAAACSISEVCIGCGLLRSSKCKWHIRKRLALISNSLRIASGREAAAHRSSVRTIRLIIRLILRLELSGWYFATIRLIIRLIVQLIIRLILHYQLWADNQADNQADNSFVVYRSCKMRCSCDKKAAQVGKSVSFWWFCLQNFAQLVLIIWGGVPK